MPERTADRVLTPIGKPGVWLAAAETASLIRLLRDSVIATPFVFLESATQAILASLADYLSDPPQVPPDRWRAGRAFGIACEIRWQTVDVRRVTLILLAERDQADSLPLPELMWRPSDWADRLSTITTSRTMPVISTLGGQLRALDYHDRQSGAVVITRLCEWLHDDLPPANS